MADEGGWESIVGVIIIAAALYGGYTFFFSAEEITFEFDITCSAEGWLEIQINGETVDGSRSSEPCGAGKTYSGIMDLKVEEGDVVQLVNLQENAYECEVVISQRELSNNYAFCED